jgi:hypothetical protein
MLKKFAVVLLATSMSAGSVDARLLGSTSLTHAHFPTCPRVLSKQSVYAAPRMDQLVTNCVEAADIATPSTVSAGSSILVCLRSTAASASVAAVAYGSRD